MVVNSREQAWAEANKLFPTDYEKDESASSRAGYDIYRHPTLNYYSRICDLNDRLEVLTGEYGENVTNIWIEETVEKVIDVRFTEDDLYTLRKLIAESGWARAAWAIRLDDKLEKAEEAICLKYGKEA
jgi:hypothetical protein